MDYVILRPGELALKGANRGFFERTLVRNLEAALAGCGGAQVTRARGRFYVGPTTDAVRVAKLASRVFGIANVSTATRVEPDLDAICNTACAVVGKALRRRPGETRIPFRVTARRADKSFPVESIECQRRVGAAVYRAHPRLRVDLEGAELDLGVEIRPEGAFLFLDRIDGAGGLPAGCEGRVLSLLSGGIDSPVASWSVMKRGCRVDFCHFDSRPFTGPGSLDKVRDLARALGPWQGGARLFVVPFADCQVAMKDLPKPGYRTLLYRRFMLRIADRLALAQGALALVTGDSIGQVASQTLANLGVVEAARGSLLVLRPLLGSDKQETIAVARRIGTYEISIRPFEDCCTLFQPAHPVTAGDAVVAAGIERGLDTEALVAAAVARTEVETALA